MVTNQKIPQDARKPGDFKVVNDYGITEEGIKSYMTGESAASADSQNEIPLISFVLTVSCRIVQNPAQGTGTLRSASNISVDTAQKQIDRAQPKPDKAGATAQHQS